MGDGPINVCCCMGKMNISIRSAVLYVAFIYCFMNVFNCVASVGITYDANVIRDILNDGNHTEDANKQRTIFAISAVTSTLAFIQFIITGILIIFGILLLKIIYIYIWLGMNLLIGITWSCLTFFCVYLEFELKEHTGRGRAVYIAFLTIVYVVFILYASFVTVVFAMELNKGNLEPDEETEGGENIEEDVKSLESEVEQVVKEEVKKEKLQEIEETKKVKC